MMRNILLGFAMVLMATAASEAHKAPSGWSYPLACCSNQDCQEIPATTVRETPEGYVISIRAEEHIMLIQDKVFTVPYGDGRIKDSPDGVYHLCVSRQSAYTGITYGGEIICFFVPPKGF